MLRLLTDFNDIEDGTATGLADDLVEGDLVLLHDDGEHEAWGTVTSVISGVATAEIDWDTWGAAGRYHVLPRGAWWLAINNDLAVDGNSAPVLAPSRVAVAASSAMLIPAAA